MKQEGGALAGPVVVASVIVADTVDKTVLVDSKSISAYRKKSADGIVDEVKLCYQY